MSISRLFSQRLAEALAWHPVLVLTGPRQAGKTTLLREVFPHHHYVTLDLPSLASQAERDPEAFFRDHPPPVLIDEVQYAPGLFRHVKALVDRNREARGQFILTGSQSFLLMKEVSDSLAGRCVWFELENLALAELKADGVLSPGVVDWPHLLVRGQFPELWKFPDMPAADFLRTYLATYLERDVRQILNVTSLRDFERFIRLLAARSGQLLNKTELAKDVGVSTRAIGDWLAVLEASGQIVFLEPWFGNFGKRIVKSPKVYFRDSGLLCTLLGLDEKTLVKSPFLGAVWEGFVFAEARKVSSPRMDRGRFWFYRDQTGREVDLIYEKGGMLNLLEIKWTETPDLSDATALLKLRKDILTSGSPEPPGECRVVCRTAAAFTLADGIQAVDPLQLLKLDTDAGSSH